MNFIGTGDHSMLSGPKIDKSLRSEVDNMKHIPPNNFLKSAEVHLMEGKSENGSPTFFNENIPNEGPNYNVVP